IGEPEKKVFDTWMTSSLSPQITSSLVNNEIKIPYSLRPQAHDIIRTWAFYTIIKSYLHENKIPWENIMISGFVTLKGEKMSKSKGNVIEPQVVLEKYGADALRFWAAGSKLGEDLDYDEKDLVTGKRLVNKLFNASKFVLMNLKDYKEEKPKKLEVIDKWLLSKLSDIVDKCTEAFESYEYSKSRGEVDNFFWHTFCDNYLEIVKGRIYQGSSEEKISAQYVLYTALSTILKLIAPIMPFITEKIYHERFAKDEKYKSIHLSSWPDLKIKDEKAEKIGDIFIEILNKVRQSKSENQKSMKAEIILTIEKEKLSLIKEVISDFKSVTNAKEIKEGNFEVTFL
ncbi:class I tRNA ligase family protein, partial [Candidatus Pacearchaeota archaeon]|nr:class I tRNA ligase family protein [Candidatus Pacearchaeota archaeon]